MMEALRRTGLFGLWMIALAASVVTAGLIQFFLDTGLFCGALIPFIIMLGTMAYLRPMKGELATRHRAFACVWLLTLIGSVMIIPAIGIGTARHGVMSKFAVIEVVLSESFPAIPPILVTLFWLAHTVCRDPNPLRRSFARGILFGFGFIGIFLTSFVF